MKQLPVVTVKCRECKGDIGVEVRAPADEFATEMSCPNCGLRQRVTVRRRPW